MNTDPIRGHTIQFTFNEGPMAKKTFEHVFDSNGTVRFRMVGGAASSAGARSKSSENAPDPKYEVVMVRDEVGAVSYLGSGGYTLTTILDFKTKKLVAFSSNEEGVSVQRGTFEITEAAARAHSQPL